MTDLSREQRMQAIIAQSRKLFLSDALEREAALRVDMELWARQQLSHHELGEHIYRYVHTLKGMAQTVGCHHLHHLCEAADSYSILHRDEWTEEALCRLQKLVGELQAELYRERDTVGPL
jgi:HPt (histidine-containing phosphotransfer) domain-containing protein